MLTISDEQFQRASKYIKLTGNKDVDTSSIRALELVRQNIVKGISNDLVKYSLPESYLVNLQFSINGRSLQNFLALRTSKNALWEIRLLAKGVYDALPTEHKYLYSEYVMDNINTDTTNDNTIPTE